MRCGNEVLYWHCPGNKIDCKVPCAIKSLDTLGTTTWVATGRVADQYKNLSLNGLWLSYGGGVRIKVDSESDINLRIDMGFGPGGISGLYLNFAEAF